MTIFLNFAAAWSSTYANHSALRTVVTFAHVASLIVGGGGAIAADRATLLAVKPHGTAGHALQVLHATHRVVIVSLVFIVVSGLMMFAADLDALLYSRVFWIKMALVALLVVNGIVLWTAEQRARRGDDSAWRRLHLTANASVALWLLATLAGVALLNIG
jgi:hypothetical protein